VRIEWLTKALKQLDHEASFIAKDNELAATQFVSAGLKATVQAFEDKESGRGVAGSGHAICPLA